MTDQGFALWLLWLTLAVSAGVNLSLIGTLLVPWWRAVRGRENGPETVLLRGMLRGRLIMLAVHGALLVQFGWRITAGHPSPPSVFALMFLVVVLGLIADGVSHMFDYRLLRGLISRDRRP